VLIRQVGIAREAAAEGSSEPRAAESNRQTDHNQYTSPAAEWIVRFLTDYRKRALSFGICQLVLRGKLIGVGA
jgi:hypothetical protein